MIDPDKVQKFYTHCDKCDTFITYRRGTENDEEVIKCRAEPYSLDEVEKMGFKYKCDGRWLYQEMRPVLKTGGGIKAMGINTSAFRQN